VSSRLYERLIVISDIHGINPSDGFPPETVQSGIPYLIMVAAKLDCKTLRSINFNILAEVK
jgi:hypothetical protein